LESSAFQSGWRPVNPTDAKTPTEEEEMTKKKKQVYPAGRDEERVRQLAERYDNQTEDEQVAEHEAGSPRDS
jgi:hypothetical protein